jgi:hypothetical protein
MNESRLRIIDESTHFKGIFKSTRMTHNIINIKDNKIIYNIIIYAIMCVY